MNYGPNEDMTLAQWSAEQKEFAEFIQANKEKETILALRERAFGKKEKA